MGSLKFKNKKMVQIAKGKATTSNVPCVVKAQAVRINPDTGAWQLEGPVTEIRECKDAVHKDVVIVSADGCSAVSYSKVVGCELKGSVTPYKLPSTPPGQLCRCDCMYGGSEGSCGAGISCKSVAGAWSAWNCKKDSCAAPPAACPASTKESTYFLTWECQADTKKWRARRETCCVCDPAHDNLAAECPIGAAEGIGGGSGTGCTVDEAKAAATAPACPSGLNPMGAVDWTIACDGVNFTATPKLCCKCGCQIAIPAPYCGANSYMLPATPALAVSCDGSAEPPEPPPCPAGVSWSSHIGWMCDAAGQYQKFKINCCDCGCAAAEPAVCEYGATQYPATPSLAVSCAGDAEPPEPPPCPAGSIGTIKTGWTCDADGKYQKYKINCCRPECGCADVSFVSCPPGATQYPATPSLAVSCDGSAEPPEPPPCPAGVKSTIKTGWTCDADGKYQKYKINCCGCASSCGATTDWAVYPANSNAGCLPGSESRVSNTYGPFCTQADAVSRLNMESLYPSDSGMFCEFRYVKYYEIKCENGGYYGRIVAKCGQSECPQALQSEWSGMYHSAHKIHETGFLHTRPEDAENALMAAYGTCNCSQECAARGGVALTSAPHVTYAMSGTPVKYSAEQRCCCRNETPGNLDGWCATGLDAGGVTRAFVTCKSRTSTSLNGAVYDLGSPLNQCAYGSSTPYFKYNSQQYGVRQERRICYYANGMYTCQDQACPIVAWSSPDCGPCLLGRTLGAEVSAGRTQAECEALKPADLCASGCRHYPRNDSLCAEIKQSAQINAWVGGVATAVWAGNCEYSYYSPWFTFLGGDLHISNSVYSCACAEGEPRSKCSRCAGVCQGSNGHLIAWAGSGVQYNWCPDMQRENGVLVGNVNPMACGTHQCCYNSATNTSYAEADCICGVH